VANQQPATKEASNHRSSWQSCLLPANKQHAHCLLLYKPSRKKARIETNINIGALLACSLTYSSCVGRKNRYGVRDPNCHGTHVFLVCFLFRFVAGYHLFLRADSTKRLPAFSSLIISTRANILIQRTIPTQGPAGSGKSTYCHVMQEHVLTTMAGGGGGGGSSHRRRILVGNLDPAAEQFQYDPLFDIRDLITVEDSMQELGLGPNGGLLYCMEYLLQNKEWLEGHLETLDDEDVLLLDCPGQLELYTNHSGTIQQLFDTLKAHNNNASYKLVSVFCIDAAFLIDTNKFLSGCLLALSAMIAMELPHINLLTKCDLMSDESIERILEMGSATQIYELDPDNNGGGGYGNNDDDDSTNRFQQTAGAGGRGATALNRGRRRRRRFEGLTSAICQLLDDWQMVSFLPLNPNDEDSVQHALATIDHAVQYGEDLEVRGCDEIDDAYDDEGDYDGDG